MIVLHASWDSDSNTLNIWGEDSKLFSNKPKYNFHPFACNKNCLLTNVKKSCDLESIDVKLLLLKLPSSSKRVVPSPELIIDDYSFYSKPDRMLEWKVHAISLYNEQIVDFLSSINYCTQEDIVYSNSLRFWIIVGQFAMELLANGRYMPIMELKKDGTPIYEGKWKINLTKSYADRVTHLSKIMFPDCKINQEQNNYEQIISFLNMFIDTFIRMHDFKKTYKKESARNVYDEWFLSLLSKNSMIKNNVGTVENLYAQIKFWNRQIENTLFHSPFRTCFKVEPKNDNKWMIQFLLQSNDDPSLIIPLEDVWDPKSLKFLNIDYVNASERLLEDIAKASKYFSELEKSLEGSMPQTISISTVQFYKFLRETVPILEERGFGVFLPSFIQKPERIGIKVRVKSSNTGSSKGLMNLDNILEYDWSVAIGDKTISKYEFKRLVELKLPIINIKGKWIELKTEDVEKAINFFEKRNKKGIGLGEAIKLNLSGDHVDTGFPIISLEGDNNLKKFLNHFNEHDEFQNVKVPETFNGILREYQIRGFSWLNYMKSYGFGACLADDMGLGKTIQTIALLLHDKKLNNNMNPSLIICPMSIVGNWVREIEKFAPSLRVMVHHGNERLTGTGFLKELKKKDILITTYATATRDFEILSNVKWNYIVLDEAQNIKNHETKQSRAVKAINAYHRIALTGTPIENRLTELWSIMEFLNKGYLGSFKSFKENFIIPVERDHNIEKAKALKRIVQPFILRRLKTDKDIINDLPDKMEIKVYCNLTKEQATLYEATVEDMMNKINSLEEGIERKGLVLSTIMKLKQICNHPAHFLGDKSKLDMRSGKLERLKEMVEEAISEGDKILIFTQFAEMGALLKQHLQEHFHQEVLFLHGVIPQKQRDLMVERFQSTDPYTPKIFVLSLKAGGLGLNLTAANRVFHFDRWWNPAVENQATDRAFRIKQRKNVYVYKYIVLGTIEEKVDSLIESKKELAEQIIGTGEKWLTELSTDELRNVLKLNKSSVED
ncbi:MAG: DEAD/DEAH box helicase [Thermoplasmata archaeon]